ncbi:MAG: CBS domain-containing protein [Nitrososphaerota archaeon]|nr:CBS domain-containing protein [Nitrososphaerota archaeon]
MQVNQAFPKLFSRSTPLLDGGTPVLEAARILTSLQVSAVLIMDKRTAKDSVSYKALTGYSILSKLPGKQGSFSRFLASQCKDSARTIKIVKDSSSLENVVAAINDSHLGVVLVSGRSGNSQILSTVELRDFVRLYRDGRNLLETNLKVGDLASSPVLSVKSASTLEDLIKTMLDYKVRKILVPETRTLISDRDILSYITSPGMIEAMNESSESLLKTPASELPSSKPPVVDSRMSIAEAAQLMNPDTGDCLICDRGLVTFWDLVIKLEQSRKNADLVLQELTSSSVQSGNAVAKTQRPKFQEDREMTEPEKKQFSAIGKRMKAQGFVAFDEVPYFARRKLVDPLYIRQPARLFQIMGVSSAGHKGAIKFSSVDLFGLRKLDESYFVLDWEKFGKFISQRLEVMFRATNPNPSKHMKKAFTRFMHNFGLHWTDCYHLIKESKREMRKVAS